MAKVPRSSNTNDRFAGSRNWEQHISSGVVSTFTSAPTSIASVVTKPCVVVGAVLSATMGVDASNPLSVSVQATNTNTTKNFFSTVPSLAKSAGNVFASTAAGASTGVVPAVLSATATDLVCSAGDVIKIVWTLTRTASPGTEIGDAAFKLITAELNDFDNTAG